MKRLKLLIMTLLLLGTASAQQKTIVHNEQDNTVTITRTLPQFVNKHDIRVGLGSFSLVQSLFLDEFGWHPVEDYTYDFRYEMEKTDSYSTPRYFTGMFSLSYTYHSRRWFEFGGTAYFGAVTESRLDNNTHKKVKTQNTYAFGVMPTVRFVYLYREKVQLYSSVSVGVVSNGYEVLPWGDLTLFGCTFGRNLFGFAEIGSGFGGWGRIGIGYRFDAAKKGKK